MTLEEALAENERLRLAVEAMKERCARVAEMDVDWSRFGKKDLEPWEGGVDGIRDYRLGIASGRAIATAIRNLPDAGLDTRPRAR